MYQSEPGLVVRGVDLSCEGSSSGKLVGDAAVRPRTGRLASEGLDEDLHAFPETQLQVKGGLCRAYTPGTHARKKEDGLLLEFPCNSSCTRSV
jgi:hypothetical protein